MRLLTLFFIPIFSLNLSQIEYDLYDQNILRSYNLEISRSDLVKMNNGATKETKVRCNITFNYNTPENKTYSFPSIGCGFGGSIGSLRICFDYNNVFNGNCRRLSMRVDTQEFKPNVFTRDLITNRTSITKYKLPDDSFLKDFRKFNFNGMPTDLSMLSERTAYYLMNKLGMIAPYSVHAKLYINGNYFGIYSFVEPVEKVFAKIRFVNDGNKGEGALFKDLWLNDLHVKDAEDSRKGGDVNDTAFIRQVMNQINLVNLTRNATLDLMNKYFHIPSLVNLIAFNTVIGSKDDWRQRHNFNLYITKNKLNVRKIVFIPWDYDRLYGGSVGGVLGSNYWWNISATANPLSCSRLIMTPRERSLRYGTTANEVAWWKNYYEQLPLDTDIPVTCDKFTSVMSLALRKRIASKIKYFISSINSINLRAKWSIWNAQISQAVQADNMGPGIVEMYSNQNELYNHIQQSMQKALIESNLMSL